MQVPVSVEPVSSELFRAQTGPIPGLVAEGRTREEAVEKLRDQLQNNLTVASPNIIMVDVPLKADAWHAYIGSIPDDELMGEWRKAVDDYRRQKDEELKDQVG